MSLLADIVKNGEECESPPINKREALLFTAAVCMLYGASVYLGLELYFGLAVLGLGAAFLVLRNDVMWISLSIVGFLPVVWNPTAEFTLTERLHALLLYSGMAWWFIRRIVIERKPIRWSTGGILYTAFCLYVILTWPIAFMHSDDSFVIVRETAALGGAMLFIPIRHTFNTATRQKLLLFLLLIVIAPVAIKNIFGYQQRVISAVAYWQVGAMRLTVSVFLFFVGAMLSLALLISERRLLPGLLWAGFLALSLGGALLSFFRSIWISILFGVVMMGVYLGWRYWRNTIIYASIALFVMAFASTVMIDSVRKVEVIASSLTDRFFSMKRFRVDPSLINRKVETAALLDQTGMALVTGRGVSSQVTFRNYITGRTVVTAWSHNGFAWLMFHFGIIGTTLALGAYAYYLVRSWILQRRVARFAMMSRGTKFRWRAMIAACGAIVAGLLIFSVFSNQFLDREAALIMAIVWGMLDLWHDQVKHHASLTTFPCDE